ncbi:MAG TPA: hypothetical protein VES20_02655 [Bryobacteraceae bacterium]|nr:hypothetical protein [Bryobacteraceae bacterium]
MRLAPILISILLTASFLAVLMVFGHKDDQGYSLAQRLIRSWFRLSRWTYAQAKGWDEFLVHYRRACSARRRAFHLAMNEPLPDLSTPTAAEEVAQIEADFLPENSSV